MYRAVVLKRGPLAGNGVPCATLGKLASQPRYILRDLIAPLMNWHPEGTPNKYRFHMALSCGRAEGTRKSGYFWSYGRLVLVVV